MPSADERSRRDQDPRLLSGGAVGGRGSLQDAANVREKVCNGVLRMAAVLIAGEVVHSCQSSFLLLSAGGGGGGGWLSAALVTS